MVYILRWIMIMARRKLKDKLINKNDMTEQLSLINGSNTDYITAIF